MGAAHSVAGNVPYAGRTKQLLDAQPWVLGAPGAGLRDGRVRFVVVVDDDARVRDARLCALACRPWAPRTRQTFSASCAFPYYRATFSLGRCAKNRC